MKKITNTITVARKGNPNAKRILRSIKRADKRNAVRFELRNSR